MYTINIQLICWKNLIILKNICFRLKKNEQDFILNLSISLSKIFKSQKYILNFQTIHFSATYNFVNSKMMIWLEASVVHSLLVRSSPRAHSILLSFLRTRTQRTCKNPKQPVFDRPLNVFRRLTMTCIYGANPLIGARIFHLHLWFADLFYYNHDHIFKKNIYFWTLFHAKNWKN